MGMNNKNIVASLIYHTIVLFVYIREKKIEKEKTKARAMCFMSNVYKNTIMMTNDHNDVLSG
jgi:hypothetical protein